MAIQPIILVGGTGSRLWPLSRELYPKQVIQLTGDLSLLQNTVQRITSLKDVLDPIIVVGVITSYSIHYTKLYEEYLWLNRPQVSA